MKRYFHSIKHYLDEELFHLPDSPRRQLALLLIALGIGMVSGIFFPFGAFAMLWLAGMALILIGAFRKNISWSMLAIGMLLIGLSRGEYIGTMRVNLKQLVGTQLSMAGTVVNFGREGSASWSFVVDVDDLEGAHVSFPLRTTSPSPMERGSRVSIACKLRELGSGFACQGGTVKNIAGPSFITHTLNQLRAATYEKVAAHLSPDRAALLAGMVYGGDESLPKSTRDDFRASGLSHLIAVSGANLALVTVTLYGFLTAWFLRRKKAALVCLVILGGAIVFVGLDPSVVRAGIMGSLILIGYLLGRSRSSGNALLLAAMLMLFMNPWLIFDLGFLLSFSATAGLMFLAAPMEKKLVFIPEFGSMRGAAALALSAWLSTMPVLALTLGSVQIISPIANLFAVPFAFFIFTIGVAFCCVAWFIPVATLIAPILGFLLDALRFIAALFAKVPFGTLTGSFAVWSAVIASFALMLWLLRTEQVEKSIAKS